jgi:hypothetical protein
MGDLMIFTSDGRGGAKPFADVFFDQPNGVLLPTLIRACVTRYSTAEGEALT